MSQTNISVTIVGAGAVGLILALCLSRAGISVAIVEAKKPKLHWPTDSLDARVTSINNASQRILEHLEVWSFIRDQYVTPLRQMQVWDQVSGGEIDFDSARVGVSQLGFIVENREMIRVLWEQLNQHSNVHFFVPQRAKKIIRLEKNIELIFEDETSLVSKLVVGADGGDSWVREQMSTEVIERSYFQKALVAIIRSQHPHQNIALQHFLPLGPVALLPLAHSHHSALIWSCQENEVSHFIHMNENDFNRELTLRMNHYWGDLSLLSERHEFPLIMKHAKHYVEERMALIGDAAHTLHPLAGQGGNLGIMDAACLAQCLIEAHDNKKDLGSLRPLRRYERWRKCENTLMIAAMRAFKDIFESASPLLIQSRGFGFNFANRRDWIKNFFMKYAMGDVEDLPELAKQ